MTPAKYLFVGSKGCGKTSLILALLDRYDPKARISPTQGMERYGPYIDLPGNYFDNPSCYPILSVCAQQARLIVLVRGADQHSAAAPEGFAQLFVRPVLGVITKMDKPRADRERAELWLQRAGVSLPIYAVSARTGDGMASFRQFLEQQSV